MATDLGFGFDFLEFGADGVVGLGFGREFSTYYAPSFWQTLVGQGQPPDHVFGFALDKSNPEFLFGGMDNGRFEGNLTFLNVTVGDPVVRIS